MIYSDYAALVKRLVEHDKSSSIDTSSIAYTSDFSKEIIRLTATFLRITSELFVYRQALTLALNDLRVDLGAAAKTSPGVWWAERIWISNSPLQRVGMAELTGYMPLGAPTEGTPRYWARAAASYAIHFDRKCPAGLTNCFVDGYRDPVAITANDQAIEVPEDMITASAMFCAKLLAVPAVSDDVALTRLEMYDRATVDAIKRRRHANQVAYHTNNAR